VTPAGVAHMPPPVSVAVKRMVAFRLDGADYVGEVLHEGARLLHVRGEACRSTDYGMVVSKARLEGLTVLTGEHTGRTYRWRHGAWERLTVVL
jgi:hypothetical protein